MFLLAPPMFGGNYESALQASLMQQGWVYTSWIMGQKKDFPSHWKTSYAAICMVF